MHKSKRKKANPDTAVAVPGGRPRRHSGTHTKKWQYRMKATNTNSHVCLYGGCERKFCTFRHANSLKSIARERNDQCPLSAKEVKDRLKWVHDKDMRQLILKFMMKQDHDPQINPFQ